LSYTNICARLSTTPSSALTRAYASRAPPPSPFASVSRTYASTSKSGESRSTLARVARPVVVVVVVVVVARCVPSRVVDSSRADVASRAVRASSS
jgi:hypothetical protein